MLKACTPWSKDVEALVSAQMIACPEYGNYKFCIVFFFFLTRTKFIFRVRHKLALLKNDFNVVLALSNFFNDIKYFVFIPPQMRNFILPSQPHSGLNCALKIFRNKFFCYGSCKVEMLIHEFYNFCNRRTYIWKST